MIRIGANPIGWSNDDMLEIGGDIPLVYECLDIHRLLLDPGPVGKAMRGAERLFGRDAALLITSSPAFVRDYFVRFGQSGAPVMQLARAGGQRVLVGVEPDEVARVRPGMSVSIAPVFGVGHQSMGRVTQVFGMVNPQTQFVYVLVQLPDAALIPGTRVHAEIQVDQQTGWTVQRSAVLLDEQGSYIFQVHDGRAHRVNVKTGLERGGLVLVQGGFASGEPVVSLGNYELRNGMAVRGSAR